MKKILPLVAAALLVPGLSHAMSVVTLQCKLKIVKADFVDRPPTQKSFQEDVEVRVKTHDKNTFGIEINGVEFTDSLLVDGSAKYPGSATQDEWRADQKSGDDRISTTRTLSISRLSGRMEYRKIQFLAEQRATTAEASGACVKNDTTKRKF